jgi:signal transduction histidine kinase
MAGWTACAQETAELPVSPIESITNLSEKDAALAKSVRVRGVVTYLAPTGSLVILQDDTGGICVSGPRERATGGDLKVGAAAEVEGVTAFGRSLPYITRKRDPIRVSILGDGVLPEPRSATIAQLQQPAYQAIKVEVSGVVRLVQTEPFGQGASESLVITLAVEQQRLTVMLPGWRGPSLPSQWVGCRVRVRGVFQTTIVERQPQFANRLLISNLKDVQVDEAVKPGYEGPVNSVRTVRDAASHQGEASRFHLQGTVTVAVPGKGFYLEDSSGALMILGSLEPAVGDRVEVAGFPAMKEGKPVLEDSQWRSAKRAVTIHPPRVTAEGAVSGNLDGRLVQVEALLLAVSSAGEGPTLVLQGGDRVFLARFANPGTGVPSLRASSWLRLTGVCVNTPTSNLRDAGEALPASFHLLLAGPQSVEIATTPSRWTLRRIAVVVGSLVGLTGATMAWATRLRRRVGVQTAQIREHLAREAVAEERLRIARELHDSVQQDLLGITMQIKATERLLEADPGKARAALNLASAMVRRSQTETHRAVWDLRGSANEQTDLISALNEVLNGLKTEDGAKIELHCEGERRPLPAAVESHLLRVAQEAVTNALKHAQADRILVELWFFDARITLKIRDDGRGFDSDHPPSASTGHFGLFGMRERAIKIGADLRVTSRPGEGTAVQLDLPLTSTNSALELAKTSSALRLIPRPSAS